MDAIECLPFSFINQILYLNTFIALMGQSCKINLKVKYLFLRDGGYSATHFDGDLSMLNVKL